MTARADKTNRQGVRDLNGPHNGKREFVVQHICDRMGGVIACPWCEYSWSAGENCECRYRCSVCRRVR